MPSWLRRRRAGGGLEMHCLVTGAAGFIGSQLARRLLDEGHTVRGVDCFTAYYNPGIKERNVRPLLGYPAFTLLRQDVAHTAGELLEGIDLVFHQAAQAGVRASWGREFEEYTHHNILATQRLLEAARGKGLRRFVYASSSSVYGEAASLPMREEYLPAPLSPYGVSKLAAEHLCLLYHRNFGVPAVALRFFTVYGPGQRPDMAFHRFIRAALAGESLTLYGSGEQTRDFTYVGDIVEANLAAAQADGTAGRVYNLGGGSRVSVNEVLKRIGSLTGTRLTIRREAAQAGDPAHTYADTSRAAAEIGFMPRTALAEGLTAEIRYVEQLLRDGL